jgi:hypothetical protein
MTDDLAANLGSQRLAGEVRRHRHVWSYWPTSNPNERASLPTCRCGAIKDEARSRRGRTARARGNRRELELAKALGGVKVGHHGGPEDVRAGLLNVQSKVRAGSAFPSWMARELDKLPRTGGRLPALIVTDVPGRGIRRRALVVMDLDDFRELHGEPT